MNDLERMTERYLKHVSVPKADRDAIAEAIFAYKRYQAGYTGTQRQENDIQMAHEFHNQFIDMILFALICE